MAAEPASSRENPAAFNPALGSNLSSAVIPRTPAISTPKTIPGIVNRSGKSIVSASITANPRSNQQKTAQAVTCQISENVNKHAMNRVQVASSTTGYLQ